MFKKVGMVTVGITAGLLAAAPLASAGEAPHDSDHKHSHGDHHGDHHGKKKHGGDDCNINGGNAQANGRVGGDALAGALAQAPVASNIGNIVCSDILNDNLSGNAISVSVLGDDEEEEAPVVSEEDEDAAGAGAGEGAGTDADGAVSQETFAL